MRDEKVDVIYELVNGTRIWQPDDPIIENLFTNGSACDALYDQIYQANLRLCQRLGVSEDGDVETIIHSFSCICELIGKRMYYYGTKSVDKP